jgi:hypothetical protein
MLRRTILAMALVAGSLLAGLAAVPAHAAEDDRALAKSFQIGRPLGGFVITLPTPRPAASAAVAAPLHHPYDYSLGASPTAASPATPGSASGRCSATASTAPSWTPARAATSPSGCSRAAPPSWWSSRATT